mgnify:CR=1 FL=1
MIDAVMFDIDDTLIRQRDGSPIQSIVDILDMCRMAGYRIVIITARPSVGRDWTVRQLGSLGIYYDELYFCHPQMKSLIKR